MPCVCPPPTHRELVEAAERVLGAAAHGGRRARAAEHRQLHSLPGGAYEGLLVMGGGTRGPPPCIPPFHPWAPPGSQGAPPQPQDTPRPQGFPPPPPDPPFSPWGTPRLAGCPPDPPPDPGDPPCPSLCPTAHPPDSPQGALPLLRRAGAQQGSRPPLAPPLGVPLGLGPPVEHGVQPVIHRLDRREEGCHQPAVQGPHSRAGGQRLRWGGGGQAAASRPPGSPPPGLPPNPKRPPQASRDPSSSQDPPRTAPNLQDCSGPPGPP